MARFDEAAADGFVFVSAQGGSGKTVTTLVAGEKREYAGMDWTGQL
ncbi:MAG: hypothetical protein ACLRVT_04235 [Oscillospiraceae bacterium]